MGDFERKESGEEAGEERGDESAESMAKSILANPCEAGALITSERGILVHLCPHTQSVVVDVGKQRDGVYELTDAALQR